MTTRGKLQNLYLFSRGGISGREDRGVGRLGLESKRQERRAERATAMVQKTDVLQEGKD